MTKPKKPQTNPIEEAIGGRAKTKEDLKLVVKTPETPSRVLRDAPEQPLTQNEMVDLEELNRQTEERFLDNDLTQEEKRILGQNPTITTPKIPQIPVSKPNPQPETETSSQESQPPLKADYTCVGCGTFYGDKSKLNLVKKCAICVSLQTDNLEKHVEAYNKTAGKLGIPKMPISGSELAGKMEDAINKAGIKTIPAEDKDLTALKEYILDNGFTVAGVAMHIVMLCAQPMVTPATPDWDFGDRANIPDMVFQILRCPGYLEGIWPSLRIVMGSNKGNSAWTAGIATTIAFFDCIRTLPALVGLQK